MYIYIFIYICVHICIYIHTHMPIYIHTHTHILQLTLTLSHAYTRDWERRWPNTGGGVMMKHLPNGLMMISPFWKIKFPIICLSLYRMVELCSGEVPRKAGRSK